MTKKFYLELLKGCAGALHFPLLIGWVNQAFEQITKDTIKHCFENCGFSEVSLLAEEPGEEFEDLSNPQISFAAALQMLDQLQDFASSFYRYRSAVSVGHYY